MQRLMLTIVLVITCLAPLTPVPPPPPLLLTTLQAYRVLVDEHLLDAATHLLQTLVLPSFDRESAVFIDDAAAPRVVARRVRRSIWTLLTVEVINGKPRVRRRLARMSRADLDAVPVEVETCEAAIDVDTARGLQAKWRATVLLPPQTPDLGQRDGTRWIFAIDDDGQRLTTETTDPDASANNAALVAASEVLTAYACAPAEQREQRLQRVRDLLDR